MSQMFNLWLSKVQTNTKSARRTFCNSQSGACRDAATGSLPFALRIAVSILSLALAPADAGVSLRKFRLALWLIRMY